MSMEQDTCRQWHEESYARAGFRSQRFYPNEELLRFLGREFFSKTTKEERSGTHVLELGCGSGANLWMIAHEGFAVYGIDISEQGIELAKQMLAVWNTRADVRVGSITSLPYEDQSFDVVVDVLCSYCLPLKEFDQCLQEVKRVLKPGGTFFSYTPSTRSDAFKNPGPAKFIDERTLEGIKRETSPYFHNDFPFRFVSPDEYKGLLESHGFEVEYLETVGRTYRRMQEYFEYVVVVGRKL